MPYNILPTQEFAKDFRKLDKQAQDRIKNKLQEVAEDPTRYKHLHYELKGSCRLWIGKLRIIFSYDTAKQEIYLEKIALDHRYRE